MLHLKVYSKVPSQKIEMKQFVSFFAAAVFLMSSMLGHAADPDKDLLMYLPFDEGKGDKAGDTSPTVSQATSKTGNGLKGSSVRHLSLTMGLYLLIRSTLINRKR